uniref:Uncharacterized protein n=1 Tax=Ananas comosus var. bracteatus TaxID=296719 RepID=A0A6V7Q838_ANACO|nr:unnamed protein product [Ananas comosus var. bracteatus]
MQLDSQVDMELQITPAENVLVKEVELSFTPPVSATVHTQKPAKRPTRQWAAWTRQEEENFFNALRQVGKNFEKITCRVQSKNKDQVRHYYYRLVRRMNKLLGPGLYLDARNSKDTIAAMLRWWSLLEKFSCTASKLHLKPRRFKIFIEALENQLLKDRNKTRRKRPQEDIYLTPTSPILTDGHPVKLLAVDTQNINLMGSTKGAFFKRNADANTNFKLKATKGDLSTTRTVKQKRRAGGVVASSAYRRWEKAAIAGVSLVADAAEQLERSTISQNSSVNAGTFNALPHETYSDKGICSTQNLNEATIQPFVKLKLQLFPISEAIRKALEKDAHNPHLELTLSARKRIASVLDHLSRKWGSSSVASGELMLFPYNAHQEDLASYPRWTMKDTVVAADVFISVGSPATFRLRYGWFSTADLDNFMVTKGKETGCILKDNLDVNKVGTMRVDETSEQPSDHMEGQSTSAVVLPPSKTPSSQVGVENREQISGQQDNVLVNKGAKCSALSAGEWADSLISVGDLLSEASRAAAVANSDCNDETSRSCDSFDAAIAAHISAHQSTNSSPEIPISSILARSFKPFFKFFGFKDFLQDSAGALPSDDLNSSERLFSEDLTDNNNDSPSKDPCITEIFWPDSLGPLDLEAPFKYQVHDLVFGDSLSSLSRIMASSLDAFRNLSFFGTDKNDREREETCKD